MYKPIWDNKSTDGKITFVCVDAELRDGGRTDYRFFDDEHDAAMYGLMIKDHLTDYERVGREIYVGVVYGEPTDEAIADMDVTVEIL